MCDKSQDKLPSHHEDRSSQHDDLNAAFCLEESFDLSSLSFYSSPNFPSQSIAASFSAKQLQKNEDSTKTQRTFYQMKHRAQTKREDKSEIQIRSYRLSKEKAIYDSKIMMMHSEHRHSRSIESLQKTLTKIQMNNKQLSWSTVINNDHEIMFQMTAKDYSGRYQDSKIITSLNLFINKEEDEDGSHDQENNRKRQRQG